MHISFIAAHADDAEIWAGGTLLKQRDHGAHVTVLLRRPTELRRLVEQRASAIQAGFELFLFESELELEATLVDLSPDTVITHWTDDSHPEHRAVAAEALRAIRRLKVKTKRPRRLLACDTYNKLGLHEEFSPTVYVDISEFLEQKRELIGLFNSQDPDFWIHRVELATALYGARCGCVHAEGFMDYSLLGERSATKGLLE